MENLSEQDNLDKLDFKNDELDKIEAQLAVIEEFVEEKNNERGFPKI